jgi:hypothetical protein
MSKGTETLRKRALLIVIYAELKDDGRLSKERRRRVLPAVRVE